MARKYRGKSTKKWDAFIHTLLYHVTTTQSASDDGGRVYVSIESETHSDTSPGDLRFDWKMYLERYSGGKWNQIGYRTGYVSEKSPSHREFTNIGTLGSRVRVRVVYYEGSRRIGTQYGPEWIK